MTAASIQPNIIPMALILFRRGGMPAQKTVGHETDCIMLARAGFKAVVYRPMLPTLLPFSYMSSAYSTWLGPWLSIQPKPGT